MSELLFSTAVFVQTLGMLVLASMLVLNERRTLGFARRLLAAVPVDNMGRPRLLRGRTAMALARFALTWGLAGFVLAVAATWYFVAFGYSAITVALFLLFWALWYAAYRNLSSPFHSLLRARARMAARTVRLVNELVFRARQRMLTGQERWLPQRIAALGAVLLVAGTGIGALSGLA